MWKFLLRFFFIFLVYSFTISGISLMYFYPTLPLPMIFSYDFLVPSYFLVSYMYVIHCIQLELLAVNGGLFS